MKIGVRREDKSRFEARVPLVPDDVADLISRHGVPISVEPSEIRAFADDAYRQVGAELTADLSDCDVIFGVKEISLHAFQPGKAYVFFSHTIKGQPHNMPMLRRMMELGCTLIDYERIVDEGGQRLVFFGNFAGLAGMIDTLWALGRRLGHQGIDNPFTAVRQACEYDDLEHAKGEIAQVGQAIRRCGLPSAIDPLVCGFAGYGNVSQGAQEILGLLPVREISPEQLLALPGSAEGCHKVVFREEHLVERIDGSQPFGLQEYYDHPDRYGPALRPYLDHLTMLVNCIYWEPKYPRLVTRDDLAELFGRQQRPRLRVIGDITCDVDGSVECTVRATASDQPVYVYEPATGNTRDGVAGEGPVVLANDTLPCELPVDSSRFFSGALRDWAAAVARADFTADLPASGLPPELLRATILYKGELTQPYEHLTEHVR